VKGERNGIMLFALALVVTTAVTSNCVAATELIVHSGESIQDAVSNSRPGDEIIVEPGVYKEQISTYTDDLTIMSQSSNPDDARRMLNQELKKGHPCILSVKNWEHWNTVVSYQKGKYVVIDSELDKVVSVQTSFSLMRNWKYTEKDNDLRSYDGYALIPKFKVHTRANFKPDKAHVVMYDKNDDIAKKWDQYTNDLITICKPRTKLSLNIITFSEFLRRNEVNLIKRIANWHGEPTYSELKKILANMKFIADVYDLIIAIDDEKRAVIDLASILMMYSCGKYGMEPIY